MRIAVCDVGLGNLRSVEKALREAARGLTVDVRVTADPAEIRVADRLVMPGQGAFGDCARALAGDLGQAVVQHVRAGRPYLGICLGLQILFSGSGEAPGSPGLGVFPGRVERLQPGVDPATGRPQKVPHVGWNTVQVRDGHGGLLPAGAAPYFYFVHSFAVRPDDASIVAGTTEYGETFVSAVSAGPLFACQFHPEKSGRAGLALLERFLVSP